MIPYITKILAFPLLFISFFSPINGLPSAANPDPVTIAVIGDYGTGNEYESAVANLVKSWNPAFIISTGDGYRSEAGGAGDQMYDYSTGKDYCPFLGGITTSGTYCPSPGPAIPNRFFPSLGNHDYTDTGVPFGLPIAYTQYFHLPGTGVASANTSGNERYYDFIQGQVQFFVINSSSETGREPDGTSQSSLQASWLKTQLAQSTAVWKIVIFHHPPYSSGNHGSNAWMQWPFAQWGADVVIAGHDHDYERIQRYGIPYFVNGIGGAPIFPCGVPVPGSQLCFAGSYGAQRVTVTATTLEFEFITVDGLVRDDIRIDHHRSLVYLPIGIKKVNPVVADILNQCSRLHLLLK